MKAMADMDFAAGEILLFDKPKTWTSFDVVKKIRGLVRVKKVGHAGTLDPLATGLLIICTGKKTKTIESLQGKDKEYIVEFRLGATTQSYDSEHPPENEVDASHVTRETVELVLPNFRGEILQYPPVFSAVKVNGRRAYKSARKGQDIKVNPRVVNVPEFELLGFEGPELVRARVVCSKGTYIRSLVHDVGQALKVGAYILELKRTRIGDFDLANAWEINEFASQFKALREAQKTSE